MMDLKLAGLLILLCICNYWNSLRNGFTFDDHLAILSNKNVKSSSLNSSEFDHSLWKNDFWGKDLQAHDSHRSYRPLLILVFRQIFWSFAASADLPSYFRSFAILLHSMATLLVYCVANAVCRAAISPSPPAVDRNDDNDRYSSLQQAISLGAAALFACHPVHVEAVTGVANMSEPSSCIFILLSYLAFHGSIYRMRLQTTGNPTCKNVFSSIMDVPKLIACSGGGQSECNESNVECDGLKKYSSVTDCMGDQYSRESAEASCSVEVQPASPMWDGRAVASTVVRSGLWVAFVATGVLFKETALSAAMMVLAKCVVDLVLLRLRTWLIPCHIDYFCHDTGTMLLRDNNNEKCSERLCRDRSNVLSTVPAEKAEKVNDHASSSDVNIDSNSGQKNDEPSIAQRPNAPHGLRSLPINSLYQRQNLEFVFVRIWWIFVAGSSVLLYFRFRVALLDTSGPAFPVEAFRSLLQPHSPGTESRLMQRVETIVAACVTIVEFAVRSLYTAGMARDGAAASPSPSAAAPGSWYLGQSELIRRAENPFAFLDSHLEKFLSLSYLQFRYALLLIYPTQQSPEYSYNCIPKVAALHDHRNIYSLTTATFVVALLIYAILKKVQNPDSLERACMIGDQHLYADPSRDTVGNGGDDQEDDDCRYETTVSQRAISTAAVWSTSHSPFGSSDDLLDEDVKTGSGAVLSEVDTLQPNRRVRSGDEIAAEDNCFVRDDPIELEGVRVPDVGDVPVVRFASLGLPSEEVVPLASRKRSVSREDAASGARSDKALEKSGSADCNVVTSGNVAKRIACAGPSANMSNKHDSSFCAHSPAILASVVLDAALVWCLVPHIPGSGIVLKLGTLLAERLLYTPSIGFCILLSTLIYFLAEALSSLTVTTTYAAAAKNECKSALGNEHALQENASEEHGHLSMKTRAGCTLPFSAAAVVSSLQAAAPSKSVEQVDEKRVFTPPVDTRSQTRASLWLYYWGIIAVIVAIYMQKSRNYNTAWKSDLALFTHAVSVCPNSAKLNLLLAKQYIMSQTSIPLHMDPVSSPSTAKDDSATSDRSEGKSTFADSDDFRSKGSLYHHQQQQKQQQRSLLKTARKYVERSKRSDPEFCDVSYQEALLVLQEGDLHAQKRSRDSAQEQSLIVEKALGLGLKSLHCKFSGKMAIELVQKLWDFQLSIAATTRIPVPQHAAAIALPSVWHSRASPSSPTTTRTFSPSSSKKLPSSLTAAMASAWTLHAQASQAVSYGLHLLASKRFWDAGMTAFREGDLSAALTMIPDAYIALQTVDDQNSSHSHLRYDSSRVRPTHHSAESYARPHLQKSQPRPAQQEDEVPTSHRCGIYRIYGILLATSSASLSNSFKKGETESNSIASPAAGGSISALSRAQLAVDLLFYSISKECFPDIVLEQVRLHQLEQSPVRTQTQNMTESLDRLSVVDTFDDASWENTCEDVASREDQSEVTVDMCDLSGKPDTNNGSPVGERTLSWHESGAVSDFLTVTHHLAILLFAPPPPPNPFPSSPLEGVEKIRYGDQSFEEGRASSDSSSVVGVARTTDSEVTVAVRTAEFLSTMHAVISDLQAIEYAELRHHYYRQDEYSEEKLIDTRTETPKKSFKGSSNYLNTACCPLQFPKTNSILRRLQQSTAGTILFGVGSADAPTGTDTTGRFSKQSTRRGAKRSAGAAKRSSPSKEQEERFHKKIEEEEDEQTSHSLRWVAEKKWFEQRWTYEENNLPLLVKLRDQAAKMWNIAGIRLRTTSSRLHQASNSPSHFSSPASTESNIASQQEKTNKLSSFSRVQEHVDQGFNTEMYRLAVAAFKEAIRLHTWSPAQPRTVSPAIAARYNQKPTTPSYFSPISHPDLAAVGFDARANNTDFLLKRNNNGALYITEYDIMSQLGRSRGYAIDDHVGSSRIFRTPNGYQSLTMDFSPIGLTDLIFNATVTARSPPSAAVSSSSRSVFGNFLNWVINGVFVQPTGLEKRISPVHGRSNDGAHYAPTVLSEEMMRYDLRETLTFTSVSCNALYWYADSVLQLLLHPPAPVNHTAEITVGNSSFTVLFNDSNGLSASDTTVTTTIPSATTAFYAESTETDLRQRKTQGKRPVRGQAHLRPQLQQNFPMVDENDVLAAAKAHARETVQKSLAMQVQVRRVAIARMKQDQAYSALLALRSRGANCELQENQRVEKRRKARTERKMDENSRKDSKKRSESKGKPKTIASTSESSGSDSGLKYGTVASLIRQLEMILVPAVERSKQ